VHIFVIADHGVAVNGNLQTLDPQKGLQSMCWIKNHRVH